ncbi:MAG: sigma 54-interacting transcriptional regulator [Thermodesulfobacteriota bacterium]
MTPTDPFRHARQLTTHQGFLMAHFASAPENAKPEHRDSPTTSSAGGPPKNLRNAAPKNMVHKGVSFSEAILESILHGAFTVDLDFTITSFNRSAENITGYKRSEAIGMKCYHIFRADICKSNCPLKKSMETGRDVCHQRVTIKDIDGDDVQIIVCTSVLRNTRQEIIGGVETFRDISSVSRFGEAIVKKYSQHSIISKNEKIRQILATLPSIAASDSTVLIEGPSGSGKELFAKAIHNLAGRKGKFVALNCAALPDTLLESELFGYKKGAFTGATSDKPGRFALAEKGTIFLDEIGDISPALQLKLLRILQEREYEPLGGTETFKADVRVIAATNKNLREQIDKGAFREDLFYRLNVIKITLPSLAERREDIPLLVHHFIEKFNSQQGKKIEAVSPRVLNILMSYDYPGNIRELENIIEYCFVLCQGNIIDPHCLPEGLREPAAQEGGTCSPVLRTAAPTLSTAEAETIIAALRLFNGNRSQTAAHLGIDKTTLWRKMKKYRIRFPAAKGKAAGTSGAESDLTGEKPGAAAKKILIVDDNTDSRELVRKILGRENYQLHEAIDGEDALRKIGAVKPDLVLMDISMPKLDGLEVTHRIKKEHDLRDIKIVALTAHALPADRERALAIGCIDYIVKPINVREFGGRIKLLLEDIPLGDQP